MNDKTSENNGRKCARQTISHLKRTVVRPSTSSAMLCREAAGGTNAGHVNALTPSHTRTHRTCSMKYQRSTRAASVTAASLSKLSQSTHLLHAVRSLQERLKCNWTNALAAWWRSAPASSEHPACWGPLVEWNLCFALCHFPFVSCLISVRPSALPHTAWATRYLLVTTLHFIQEWMQVGWNGKGLQDPQRRSKVFGTYSKAAFVTVSVRKPVI